MDGKSSGNKTRKKCGRKETVATKDLMEELDLSGNDFGDRGVEHICKCVRNTRSLKLERCGVTPQGCEMLSNEISTLQQPMEELDLRGNDFGDDGVAHICKCVRNTRRLKLWRCDITPRGCEMLSNEISTLQQPMEELDLGWNSIGDRGVEHICKCVRNTRRLKLMCCGVTPQGCEMLSNEISTLQQPMNELYLGGNRIGDRGAKHLMKCGNIRELNLGVCGISGTQRRKMKMQLALRRFTLRSTPKIKWEL